MVRVLAMLFRIAMVGHALMPVTSFGAWAAIVRGRPSRMIGGGEDFQLSLKRRHLGLQPGHIGFEPLHLVVFRGWVCHSRLAGEQPCPEHCHENEPLHTIGLLLTR